MRYPSATETSVFNIGVSLSLDKRRYLLREDNDGFFFGDQIPISDHTHDRQEQGAEIQEIFEIHRHYDLGHKKIGVDRERLLEFAVIDESRDIQVTIGRVGIGCFADRQMFLEYLSIDIFVIGGTFLAIVR